MLIQFHMLQNYGPSNLNRDDTGAPKDAYLGGVRRARISSQCLKRSIRRSEVFAAAFKDDGKLAIRSKSLPGLIGKELGLMGADETTVRAIVSRVPEIAVKTNKGDSDDKPQTDDQSKPAVQDEAAEVVTKQLIFFALDEVRPLAEKLLAAYQRIGDPKKWAKADFDDVKKALGKSVPRSVDVAMFGRMTTSEAFEDVQAAVQVAHALSVNALQEEFDYYTAVDDLSGESGAGMIGDVQFNSSTYYKYFSIHWEQLVRNLGGDVAIAQRAVLALLEAAATAQPSGKQNSFGMHCLPDLLLVEVRQKNLPVNYGNGFLKPARQSAERTLTEDAAVKLADYLERVAKAYGLDQDPRCYMCLCDAKLPAEQAPSLAALQEWLGQQLPEG